jgi:hypothetical protein
VAVLRFVSIRNMKANAKLALVLSLALALALAELANAGTKEEPKQRVAAIVVPIDFSVVAVGIKSTERQPEPTAQANDKLAHSLELALARVGTFQPLALPPMSAEETTALREHLVLARVAVRARAGDVLGPNPFEKVEEPPDYSIGPGLAFLADRTGAEQLIYLFGNKYVSSGGRGAIALALSPVAMIPTKNTELGVAVVELRTGRIAWMNFVQDINADVTDRRGANAYMLPAFGDYPKTALGALGKGRDLPPARLHEDRVDQFSVIVPAGWRKVPGYFRNELTISRHSGFIDLVTINRLKLDKAFKAQAKGADPAADPLETGQLAVNEMKADVAYQSLELEGIEATTVGGKPGFRADSHWVRTYPDSNGVRIRQRLYGVATNAGLYLLKLESVSAVYFDENLPAFDALVASLTLGPIKVKPAT